MHGLYRATSLTRTLGVRRAGRAEGTLTTLASEHFAIPPWLHSYTGPFTLPT